MDKHTEKAIHGAALAPLTNEQKKRLILLARRAFAKQSEISNLKSEISFDAWRHAQQVQAVERSSLCSCTNEDYLFLKAHYLRLLGEEEKAEVLQVKAVCEPRLWALSRLHKECEAAADVIPGALKYAEGFLRNCRKINLDQASEKQLWHAIYVVRRRASQLRRSGTALWRSRQKEKAFNAKVAKEETQHSSDDSDLSFP